MAKGKRIFVALRSSVSNEILKTITVNKVKHKISDYNGMLRYCPTARKRVPVLAKEIKKAAK